MSLHHIFLGGICADLVMVAKIMGFECSQSELGHLLSMEKHINLYTHKFSHL